MNVRLLQEDVFAAILVNVKTGNACGKKSEEPTGLKRKPFKIDCF